VLYIQSEDSEEAVLLPRVRHSGANLALIHSLGWVITPKGEESLRIPADVRGIEEYAKTLYPPVQLVVIDPVFNYLAGVDTYVEAEVRTALQPLLSLAKNLNAAVVLCRHLTKAARGKASLDNGMGSQGFGALARSTLGVERASGGWRKVMSVGSNYGKEPPTLYFRILDFPALSSYDALDDWEREMAQLEYDPEGEPLGYEWTEEDHAEHSRLTGTVEDELIHITETWRPVEWATKTPAEAEQKVGLDDNEEEPSKVEAPKLSDHDQAGLAFLDSIIPPEGIGASDLTEAAETAGFNEQTLKRAKKGKFESVRRGKGWYWVRV